MALNQNNGNQPFQDAVEKFKPAVLFVVIIFSALVAFEVFNYSTTDHALQDLLGDLRFAGLRWSTILALAFCGIDFAGIARLFTPEQGADEPKEVWYLFGAWLLAATMNAILTWWGVSIAIITHTSESTSLIDPKPLTGVIPVFVAIMVWIIRILIIGTLSTALDRLLHPESAGKTAFQNALKRQPAQAQSTRTPNIPAGLNASQAYNHPPASRPGTTRAAAAAQRYREAVQELEEEEEQQEMPATRFTREPSYHTLAAKDRGGNRSTRR